MKHIPSYGKILTLGAALTENALVGEVVVQEKVDGSQFRWGINEDGELVIGSKSVLFSQERTVEGMFLEGVNYIEEQLTTFLDTLRPEPDTYYYGEYLKSPKHNTLKYDRTPKNHIVLFDCIKGGQHVDRKELCYQAELWDVDVIPELYRGEVSRDKLMEWVGEDAKTESYLGGATIEGVVIKNYAQNFIIGGMVMPCFTKYVREEFKELHHKNQEFIPRKDKVADFVGGFRSEARWEKAFQHLRDQGLLTQSPKDIPAIIAEIQRDIKEEERQRIADFGFELLWKDIQRYATGGAAEWYKAKLLDNLNVSNVE